MVEADVSQRIPLEKYGILYDSHFPPTNEMSKIVESVKSQFRAYFNETYDRLNEMVQDTPEGEALLKRYKYDKKDLKNNIVKLLGKKKDGVKQSFPGANSITFMSDNIKTIQLKKTIVCEKTDGVRYFLVEVVVKPIVQG